MVRALSKSSRRGRIITALIAVMMTTAGSVVWRPAEVVAQEDVDPTRAPGLTAETVARYAVDIEAEDVDVTLEVTLINEASRIAFTNVFESVPVNASDVTASVGGRSLAMTPEGIVDGVTQWSIDLPTPLDPGERILLELSWRLPADGSSVVITPAVLAFDAFVGGPALARRSGLIVEVPPGFAIASAGDLELIEGATGTVLWDGRAVPGVPVGIEAERPDALFRTASEFEPDVMLADWTGDGEWARSIDEVLPDVVALLRRWFGEPAGPIEVRRRARPPSGDGQLGYRVPTAASGGADHALVAVGPDPETGELTHQLTHGWLNDLDRVEPWLIEGLASAVAATPVTDPAAAVVPVLAEEIGADGIRRVVDALRAGSISYPGSSPSRAAAVEAQPIGTDWRTVLDLFEQVGGASAEQLFRANIIGEVDVAAVDRRAAARVDYLALQERGGEWALPPLLRIPMAAWDFDTFSAKQAEVSETLATRDRLIAELDEAELELGEIARDAFESAPSGMAEVDAILERQRVALEAIVEATRLVEGDRGLLAWIGLFGDDPEVELDEAIAAWDAGQFELATTRADDLIDRLEGAVGKGTLRLIIPALAIAVVVGTLRALLGRNRRRRRRVGSAQLPAASSAGS